MKLNIYNNFRAFYYNTLINFYLYFNTLVPYYDDVILSLSITSLKNIINNNSISLKTINQNRMMKLLYSLSNKDKIVIDDSGFVYVDYENKEITFTDEENEIIQDNVTGDVDTQEHDTDTEDIGDTGNTDNTTNNYVADVKEPFVYTQDIVMENTFIANDPVMDTQDIVIEEVPVSNPFVYTQDIVIQDTCDIPDGDTNTEDTKCYNSLDKKNN